ncbi:MAG: AAA family ATPase, partial [Candidatus Desulfovibrio faecigallinarum]|nr:AAA family ATPase [Candidatus Desulfovibrio faecigallinarum]
PEMALARLQEAREALCARQGNDPLVSVEVTADVVAKVVSDWTGIPAGRVARDQAAQVASLHETLSASIRGQDAALSAICEGIQASRAGLNSPTQPMGVFLLVGPSGVGKTETGLALADALFGNRESVITINMSEFQERHTVSRLVGSPPGYVGFGEGGLLTEAVRRRPYSVVLLDEVEKAHPDVMQLFYQVFDKGVLNDGEGTQVSFRNTVILLTSNLGTDITQHLCANPASLPDQESLIHALRPTLSKHFQPALLARMRIVPYTSLHEDVLQDIAGLKLATLASRVAANNGMVCTFDASVAAWLAARCTQTDTGARNIDYVLAGTVLPTLAKNILRHMADDCPPDNVHLSVEEGELVLDFFEAGATPKVESDACQDTDSAKACAALEKS